MTVNDKVYGVTDRFYIEGALRNQDVDGTYLYDMLHKLLEHEREHNTIYDFRITQNWIGEDNKSSVGYIVVSWMDKDRLHLVDFVIEED